MSQNEKSEVHENQMINYTIESPYMEDPGLILTRLSATEKQFGALGQAFKHLVDAKVKLRDKCDNLSVLLNEIGEFEGHSHGLGTSQICEVAKCLAMCQEPLDRVSERLGSAVTRNLQSTIKYCSIAKGQVKNVEKVKAQQLKAATNISKQRERGITDYRTLKKKLSQTQGANEKSERAIQELLETIETFERKRFGDLQQVMQNYLLLELNYHSKSLEAFTESYRKIVGMRFDPTLIYSIVNEEQVDMDATTTTSESTPSDDGRTTMNGVVVKGGERDFPSTSNKDGNDEERNSDASYSVSE